jgi:hypothetical protein
MQITWSPSSSRQRGSQLRRRCASGIRKNRWQVSAAAAIASSIGMSSSSFSPMSASTWWRETAG